MIEAAVTPFLDATTGTLDWDAVFSPTVWNDVLIDGKQPDDAAIIRGFLQDWHPEKGKFKQADLQTWLGWMRRHGLVPKGSGLRTVSTNTPSLFERE